MKHSVTIAQNIITYIAQVTTKSALMCNMLMTGYHNNNKKSFIELVFMSIAIHQETHNIRINIVMQS